MKGLTRVNYPNRYWESFKDDIVLLYQSKEMTLTQIADIYNTTPTTIRKQLKQWCVYDKATACNKKNKYQDCGDYYIGYTRNDHYEFYIDKIYYDEISRYCWHKHRDGYLRTRIGQRENGSNIYKLMHVLMMELAGYTLSKTDEVDHINGKPNDNRMFNLRITNHMNNMKNEKIYKNNTSGHKGVYYSTYEQKWKATIDCDKKTYSLGSFDTKNDAIQARENAEIKFHKEYNRAKEDLHNGTR